MKKDDELMLELTKNKMDEVIVKQELEKGKEDFIRSLENGLGEEMKSGYYNHPVAYKKPFKVKFREIKNKLKKVLGI